MKTAAVKKNRGLIAGTAVRFIVMLITVITVFTLMYNVVSADEKPVYTGNTYAYDYELYFNGNLIIKNYPAHISYWGWHIGLQYLASEYLSQVKSITVDLAGYDGSYMTLSGYQCETSSISKISFINAECDIDRLVIEKIHGVTDENLLLPEGVVIDYLSLEWLSNVDSVSFLSKYQINKLKLFCLDGVETVDLSSVNAKSISVDGLYYSSEILLPDCATDVEVIGTQYLEELVVPDHCERFFVYNCNELKRITLPLSVTGFEYYSYSEEYSFEDCRSLQDIYFKGSPASFGKINVLSYDEDADSWEVLESDITLEDLLGDIQIHYFLGKKSAWIKSGDQWVYADDKGQGVTGWQKISGDWYCFNDESIMLTGWLEDGGEWYYLKESGVMAQGWQTVKGKYYYFKAGGAMASEEYCDGYWLDKSGEWNYKARASWKSDSKGWYYQDTTGWYAKNQWLKIDGKWYFFKPDGYMAYSEYWNGYWFNADGTWTYQARASWKSDSKGWYYQDTTGWYAKNQSLWINGKLYNFNAEGYCTNP